jgi:hypothetical protein
MDSMDFVWGELLRAIEMKILEEQREASSQSPSHAEEEQQQFQKPIVPPLDLERLPGERPLYNTSQIGVVLWICGNANNG